MIRLALRPQGRFDLVDKASVERRIARRYLSDLAVEIWIPRMGVLGRAKTAEFPVADMSMFGASVFANDSDKLARGQVVEMRIGNNATTAIVRSEQRSEHSSHTSRFGLEFVKPTDEFLEEVRSITDASRRLIGEQLSDEEVWLRSS